MDTRDGRIYTPDQLSAMREELELQGQGEEMRYFNEMEVPPINRQMKRKPPKVGRNEPCPCGSGKKFKKCCLSGVQ